MIKQIKLYAKLTLFIALAVVVALVVFKNRNHTVTVWFFRTYESINVLWLMLCTAAGAILAWWIVKTTRTVWRDMRELYKDQQAQREKEEMKKRADELAEAEKRIDRKIQGALHEKE